MAEQYPQGNIRKRLKRASIQIASGGDWCEALANLRLLKEADAGVLVAAQRVGNLEWALQEMADSNRRRMAYRLTVALNVAVPAVALAFGACVLVFALTLLLPLIRLLEKLS